jgi:hypothetical protein
MMCCFPWTMRVLSMPHTVTRVVALTWCDVWCVLCE